MGMFSFIKSAGEKLFGIGEAKATEAVAKADPTPVNVEAANKAAAKAIADYVAKMNLTAQDLTIGFDGATATVIVQGMAATQEDKEKILLCCGNVAGVENVQDQLGVVEAAAEPVFYTVVSGDTLSKIAKQQYGNANLYMKIFEANKPMLSHPDKIYPGQSLRIPA
ncbi:peptidoglycan-binding protein LysM [Methylotenera sp.]|uniref:peptidoglycan-binding protein LysM n=2 Tax=Pseudomonadota TaxID=1224 RepID=UPI00271E8336|nr:peptidoglycan-binding protein LysM [Methylotenera sp.]MDO9394332.1 peptidoglycan-binding protein LysM [Methylotenera sp.]MDP1523531.1 peptidoglycan-binding protein LysM [Methylotenera sp.]MDP2071170.1 peptidoglycan-binding protein LysM [Methylotenera sp.]MDP2230095.1 peptidoglycan-binding protein LysM [Methylotenera sp.]MDP3007333.1 peptidoglycan-binding protein LysM [Methylotenera sp.]